MIEVRNVTKKFDKFVALNNISCKIDEGSIFGLVGSNGAGKSTLLRIICDVFNSDSGEVLIDGEAVRENYEIKKRMVYVPDEPFFLAGANLKRMAALYANMYDGFDMDYFNRLVELFALDPKKKISGFSKGMKRQAAIILGLSVRPRYLFLDETFDGLDPVMKNLVKRILCSEITEREFTAVLTSHSLRELDEVCDQLAFIHEGGLVYEKDAASIKTSLTKVQLAFNYEYDESLFGGLTVVKLIKSGSVATLIVRDERERVEEIINSLNPIICEYLPLKLEEIFACEMEALGYKFDLDILMEGKNE